MLQLFQVFFWVVSYAMYSLSDKLEFVWYCDSRPDSASSAWGLYQRPGKVTDYFSQPGPAKVTRAV